MGQGLLKAGVVVGIAGGGGAGAGGLAPEPAFPAWSPMAQVQPRGDRRAIALYPRSSPSVMGAAAQRRAGGLAWESCLQESATCVRDSLERTLPLWGRQGAACTPPSRGSPWCLCWALRGLGGQHLHRTP